MEYSSWLLVHHTSKLNEAGVDAFASGNYELATHYLNEALAIINQLLLAHCDLLNLAADSVSRFDTATLKRRTLYPPQERDAIQVKPKTIEVRSLCDERFYVFNQALLFTAPAYGTATSPGVSTDSSYHPFHEIRADYIQVSFFWSIIHFNMALVLHQQIQDNQHDSDKRYRDDAMFYYQLCLQNLWAIPATSTTMNLLMLCTVNNLAHVCLSFHPCVDVPCGGRTRSSPFKNTPGPASTSTSRSAATSGSLMNVKEVAQGLLLRAIGNVISDDESLTQEQHDQVTEMSVNHIVISALSPSFVAPGA